MKMMKVCTRCKKKWEQFDALSYEHLCPDCRTKKRYWIADTFFKNKKGASLSGFAEASLGVILFLAVIAIIISNMNGAYQESYDGSLGFEYNSVLGNYTEYQNSLQNATSSGDASISFLGISLTSTWTMISLGLSVTWTMLSGNWIDNAVSLMQFGESAGIVVTILKLLYFLAIGFIAIKLLTRVKP